MAAFEAVNLAERDRNPSVTPIWLVGRGHRHLFAKRSTLVGFQHGPPSYVKQQLIRSMESMKKLGGMIVSFLLEANARVCASCEKEVGQMRVLPGQEKSHGICRRHGLEMAVEAGADDLYIQLRDYPDSAFCPDLREHPELVVPLAPHSEPGPDWTARPRA